MAPLAYSLESNNSYFENIYFCQLWYNIFVFTELDHYAKRYKKPNFRPSKSVATL